MARKLVIAALVGAAAIVAAPAAAQHGPGGSHGGPPSGMGGPGNAGGFGAGGPNGMGNAGGMGMPGGMNDTGVTTRDNARMNSQGPANASPTGIANANANSVLFPGTTAANTVTSGALAGLTTGTTLLSNGQAVGTVQQIRTTGQGSVAVIIVQGTNGHVYAVPANKLTFSGGMLTTTARLNGINGTTSASAAAQGRVSSQGPLHASPTALANANQHSVLASSTATATTTRKPKH